MAYSCLYCTSTTWFAFLEEPLCTESSIAYATETPLHTRACITPVPQLFKMLLFQTYF